MDKLVESSSQHRSNVLLQQALEESERRHAMELWHALATVEQDHEATLAQVRAMHARDLFLYLTGQVVYELTSAYL